MIFYFQKDISEELLRNGLAVVYRQGHAQYGSQGLQKWNEIENDAKTRKVGIWSLGADYESPAAYKAKNKNSYLSIEMCKGWNLCISLAEYLRWYFLKICI